LDKQRNKIEQKYSEQKSGEPAANAQRQYGHKVVEAKIFRAEIRRTAGS